MHDASPSTSHGIAQIAHDHMHMHLSSELLIQMKIMQMPSIFSAFNQTTFAAAHDHALSQMLSD